MFKNKQTLLLDITSSVQCTCSSAYSNSKSISLLMCISHSITISRDWLDVPQFEADHSPLPKGQSLKEKLETVLPPEPVKSALKPPTTSHEWLEFLLVHVPILHWVWTYQSRFFLGDIISGITIAVVHIPQGTSL